jgi:predicted ATPase
MSFARTEHPTMKITQVALKNWRNFRSVDVETAERVFLVGANASGKSNFLDVFRFVRDIAKSTEGGGLQKAVNDRGGLSKIRCLAARRTPNVELELDLEGEGGEKWKYSLGIKQEPRGYRQPFVSHERVWHNGQQLLSRPNKDDRSDSLRLTQTHLEQISANKGFRPVASFFASTLYLHLIPQLLRHPDSFSGPRMPGDPFGRSFLERVALTPERTRRVWLRKIEEALRLAVPQLKSLTDIKDERGIPHLQAVYEHWRPHGARQLEDQFSDGTLRLLGLLWSLLESDSLLLLEEPELSLHAAIARKLPSLIYRLQKARKRQVFISTHSAELLSDGGIDGSEVLLLQPDSEGTRVTPMVSRRDVGRLLEEGLTVAELAIPSTEPSLAALQQLDLFK